MIADLIYVLIVLAVLYLVYYLGTLLVGLIPDAQARRIVGVVWMVIYILVAISILLGLIGVVDFSLPRGRLLR